MNSVINSWDENITNPELVGYYDLIAYKEALQRASDLAEEKKQEILEKPGDDELVDITRRLLVNCLVQNILMK